MIGQEPDTRSLVLRMTREIGALRADLESALNDVGELGDKLLRAQEVVRKYEWSILTTTDCGYVVHWCSECGGYRPYDYDEVGPSRNWSIDLRGHRPNCAVQAVIGGQP